VNSTDEALDVDEIAGIVQRCPSVVRLAAGNGVEVATYLPGRRVPGVRVGDGTVEVHVVARYGKALPEVADEVRRALGASIGRRQVAVFIDDLDLDEQPSPQGGPPA
jgi:uncharacterized alkaline shock family protein YloU